MFHIHILNIWFISRRDSLLTTHSSHGFICIYHFFLYLFSVCVFAVCVWVFHSTFPQWCVWCVAKLLRIIWLITQFTGQFPLFHTKLNTKYWTIKWWNLFWQSMKWNGHHYRWSMDKTVELISEGYFQGFDGWENKGRKRNQAETHHFSDLNKLCLRARSTDIN